MLIVQGKADIFLVWLLGFWATPGGVLLVLCPEHWHASGTVCGAGDSN